ncbi:MAG: cell wall-binding repeat-containing protein [Acidimicrobiales bacterium]
MTGNGTGLGRALRRATLPARSKRPALSKYPTLSTKRPAGHQPSSRRPRRTLTALLAGLVTAQVAMVAGLAGLTAVAAPASASATFSLTRVAGASRFATAADIAMAAFPSGAGTVLLTTGTSFPDALAGNFLAGNLQAPILLTTPSGPMPGATFQAITNLKPQQVLILGGPGAVPAAQEQALAADGLPVGRIAGANRFATMADIAQFPGTAVGRDQAGVPTAILATGDSFPDALSAGPLSYADKLPVILTDGHSPTLSPQAETALTNLHIGHVIMVGGSGALNPGINTQLASMGITVTQLAGADRSATSDQLAEYEIAHWGFSTTSFAVARGDGFADALAGGAAAGKQKMPILVTPSPAASGSVTTFAAAHASTETGGMAFGGPGALSNATVAAITTSAGGVTAQGSSPSPDPSPGPPSQTPTPPSPTPAPSPVPPPTPPPVVPGSPFPPGAVGYDLSWPQCPSLTLPTGSRNFAIVGVNNGHAFSINPCLHAEGAWAGTNLSLYMNLNSPADQVHSTTGPAGKCAPTDASCLSYNYGYHAGISSMADAVQEGVSSKLWWLDVETGNNWSSDKSANARVIAGAIDALRNAGNTVAIYSTPYQWGIIAGSYHPNTPVWVATGGDPADLTTWCGPSHGFTGGAVWLVQYARGNYDGDFAC